MNEEKIRKNEQIKLRYVVTLIALLLVAVLLTSCCPQPEVVEITESDYEVKRLNAKVWATNDDSQPKKLFLLDDDSWYDLVGERMATTDKDGQAEIKGPGCTALYVYQDSGLTMSACPKGGGTGSCSTGTIVSAGCDVSIRTMPADVETVGTWFSVTYLEDLQVTLVIVAEGAVRVTPATKLDFTLVDQEQLQYEVKTRELGEAVSVEVMAGDEPRFLYTASDDRLADLQVKDVLPEARTPLSLEELPPLLGVLIPQDSNLEPWLWQIWERAGQEGLQFPELERLLPVTLVSFVDGEIRPNLAEEWSVSDDGIQWTFTLVEGREMPDGTPYTSNTVVNILTENEAEVKEIINGYSYAEAVDDYTIVIFLEETNTDFLEEVSHFTFR